MSEGETNIIASDLRTKGDKARAAADLGQEMLKEGFTHTQSSEAAAHEVKHALADSGRGEFSLKKQGDLTVPTYSSIGERTPEEKVKIALAPENPSPTDINIVEEAGKNKRKRFLGIF